MREMIDRLKQDIRELGPTSFTGKCKNVGGLEMLVMQYVLSWEDEEN